MRSGPKLENRETLALDPTAAFELRVGLRDPATGRVQRRGVMRRASARDELAVLADFRVFLDPDYVLVALLARVLSFEGLKTVRCSLLETLTIEDLGLLEDLYRELNGYPHPARKGGVHAV